MVYFKFKDLSNWSQNTYNSWKHLEFTQTLFFKFTNYCLWHRCLFGISIMWKETGTVEENPTVQTNIHLTSWPFHMPTWAIDPSPYKSCWIKVHYYSNVCCVLTSQHPSKTLHLSGIPVSSFITYVRVVAPQGNSLT